MALDALHFALLAGIAPALALAVASAISLRRSRAEARAAVRRVAERERDLDISRKRARELAVMLKSAKALRNEFLSNISHEVRTPMTTVMGMTELALSTDLTDKQRRCLERVRDAGASLLGLLNDLLDLSQIHARRLRVTPHGFQLRDCLGDLVGKFVLRARQKGLTLTMRIEEDVPDGVVGDAGRLRQMIGALLSNAIKFSDHGDVTLAVQAVSREDGIARLHFMVCDCGIGIPAEKQADIFEAFNQVDGSKTRPYGGVGIGLAIASELAHLMGGDIGVESAVGQGSTFHLTVPLGLQQPTRLPPMEEERAPLRHRPVLVINDHPEIREALAEMLQEHGMRVTKADSAAAHRCLVRACREGCPFNLVLLDASAPGTDALRLAERLLGIPELAPLRIVVITSAGRRGDAARCRELGVAAYLTFPLSASELAEALVLAIETPAGKDKELVTNHSLRERRHTPHAVPSPSG